MLQGVACGSGKLYLCFWVMKLVTLSMYKQKLTPSQFGRDCLLPLLCPHSDLDPSHKIEWRDDSVAMVWTNVFWKKGIIVSSQFVKIMGIFDKINNLENWGIM